MHYFKRNIGDYHKKAGRLTMLQHGAYTLLIDACYDREQFPTEAQAIDWCWASSPDEVDAVRFVINKFFTLIGDKYEQKRINEEIENYRKNSAINKRIAREREANRRLKSTNRARSVNEPPPNQEPRTTNQEPRTSKNNTSHFVLAKNICPQAWADFEQHRKDIRKPLKPLSRVKSANILSDLNHDQQRACVDKSISSGWAGLFPPKRDVKENNDSVFDSFLKNNDVIDGECENVE